MTDDTEPTGQGYPSQAGLTDDTTPFNQHAFQILQALARVRTAVIVKVMAVDVGGGGLAPVGFVDAMPMVKQMDGGGNTFSHGTIFNLPYIRIQGGANAVICDPVVDDLGLAVISDRDISSVKNNKGEANPGSRRKFNLSDGIYIGGILNGKPTCYVQVTDQKVVATPDDGTTTITITPGMQVLTPDGGTTTLTLTPGKIVMVADEIVVHAKNKNAWDAGGTGFVYTPNLISTYTDGVPSSHSPPTPPEVPT